MKIGTIFQIQATDKNTNEITKYKSRLIEENADSFIIDYPINELSKRTTYFKKGTYLLVSFIDEEDKSVYQFQSLVKDKVKLKIPALSITKSEEGNIKRIQRRQFVRVETALDVAIHGHHNGFVPFTTTTTDISGGGLSVIVPKENDLAEKEKVTVWIPLEMSSGVFHYLSIDAEVVILKSLKDGIRTAGLKFLSIKPKEQQTIIRFCFEVQREIRQKELT